MAAASARNLMTGSGTVSCTSGSRHLVFSSNQSFKPGATIILDYAGTPQYFTIDAGAGVNWTARQPAVSTQSGKNFKTTDTGTGRGRGSDGVFIPDAKHYMYRSFKDNSGNDDAYFYFDTVAPERGLHPYNGDQWTGAAIDSSKVAQAAVSDIYTRVRILEGMLRANATAGDVTNPDKRLDAIESRLNALDSGGNPTYTVQQMLDYGDA